MSEKKQSKTEWIKIKPEEAEKIIIDLAKKGTPPEKIGLILRDQHGIPKAKVLGKKISQILKENKMETNSEKNNLSNKIKKLKTHFEKHKHDYSAQKAIIKNSARVRKIDRLASKQ